MKIRITVAIGILLILSWGGLWIPAFLAQRGALGNLLLINPAEPGTPGLDIFKIEEFSEDEFLVSYEIPGSGKISLPHADFQVLLIGTTSSYAQIMGLEIMEGSFFSKQAWDGKLKAAVLNETAAFTIFGNTRIMGNRLKIQNETWLVTGVIRDRDDDHCRLYVPSSIRVANAAILLALIDTANGYDEAFLKKGLKKLGIQEGIYDFYNLGRQIRLFWERVWIIPLLFISFFLVSLIKPVFLEFLNALAVLKMELDHDYLAEILKRRRKIVLKPIIMVFLLVLFPSLALYSLIRTASICLPWQDIPSLAGLSRDLFYPCILELKNYEFASVFVFIFTLILLAADFFMINSLLYNKFPKIKKKPSQNKKDVIR